MREFVSAAIVSSCEGRQPFKRQRSSCRTQDLDELPCILGHISMFYAPRRPLAIVAMSTRLRCIHVVCCPHGCVQLRCDGEVSAKSSVDTSRTRLYSNTHCVKSNLRHRTRFSENLIMARTDSTSIKYPTSTVTITYLCHDRLSDQWPGQTNL